MHVEIRKFANGKPYYSFAYWDNGKRIRLKRGECPNFDSYEKALEWAKAKGAENDTAKNRALKRMEWKNQYYDFAKISVAFIEYCKKTQPNSWENTRFYLDQYVFRYFLQIRNSNNLNSWSFYFEDFKNWLEDEAYTTNKNNPKIISYNSKAHCIKALNIFLSYAIKKNLVDPANVQRVKGFPQDKLESREAESLIDKEEFNQIYNNLKESNPTVATFFECAYWTGMRFNEIFGLSMMDLFKGEINDSVLGSALATHKIEYYGYINLESQPAVKARTRLKDGTIKRKPLKGKRAISAKNSRLIPIVSKELFNNLVGLFKIQQEKFQKKVHGDDLKNYVLFEDLTKSRASLELRKAYEKTKYNPKCYHCCRHTRCTELVGKTRDVVMVQFWLGHSRQEITLKYTHIYDQSVNLAKIKTQDIDFVK